MPSRVERVTRFSVRPAVSFIEHSTRSLHTENVENEKELRNYGTAASYLGLFPVSEGHKLIQNFLQSLEPPFRNLKVFVGQLIPIKFRSFLRP